MPKAADRKMPQTSASASSPTGPSPRTRSGHRTGPVTHEEAEERRERIIAIAREEFLALGFDRASVDHIARRSNVSKATIYNDYGDKGKLFELSLVSVAGGFSAYIDDLLARSDTFQNTIEAVVRATVTGLNDTALSLVRIAIAERSRFPILAKIVLNQSKDVVTSLSKYIETYSGIAIDEEECRKRSFHLMHMALGGAATLLGSPEEYFDDHEPWIDSIVSTFLNGFH